MARRRRRGCESGRRERAARGRRERRRGTLRRKRQLTAAPQSQLSAAPDAATLCRSDAHHGERRGVHDAREGGNAKPTADQVKAVVVAGGKAEPDHESIAALIKDMEGKELAV